MKKNSKKILSVLMSSIMVMTLLFTKGITADALTQTNKDDRYNAETQFYNIGYMWESSELEKYDTLVNSISLAMNAMNLKGKSDYEKALVIYKYVTTMEYDTSLGDDATLDAYLKGKGTCGAFADLYCHMLEKAGLESKYVAGFRPGASHAWSMVKLDGKWYFCDPSGGSGSCYSAGSFGSFLTGIEEYINTGYFSTGYGIYIYDHENEYVIRNDAKVESDGRKEAEDFLKEMGVSETNYETEDGWHNAFVSYTDAVIEYDTTKDIAATCDTVGYKYCVLKLNNGSQNVFTSEGFYVMAGDWTGHDWKETSRKTHPNPEYPDLVKYQELVSYECNTCGETKEEIGYHEWTYTEAGHVCTSCGEAWEHEVEVTDEMKLCGNGPYTLTCKDTKCGMTIVIDNSDKEHTYKPVAEGSVAADCENAGTQNYACESCGHKKTEEVEALGHDWKYGEVVKEASCSETGLKADVCNRCGETANETAIEKATHTLGSFTPVDNASHSRTCGTCGEVVVTEHNYKNEVIESSCEEQGRSGKKCSDCNHWKSDFTLLPLAEHSYEKIIVDATCEEAGSVVLHCSVCGHDSEKEVPALGHEYKYVRTENNQDVFACNRCGEEYSQKHHYEYTNGTEAGDVFTCSVCKGTKVLDHKYELTQTVDATCTADGYTVKTCERCDKEVKETTVGKLGHEYTLEVTKEATCTEEGVRTYSCIRKDCDHSYTEKIEKAVHDTEAVVVKPTCTDNGYTVDVCKNCEYETDAYNETAALGHNHTSEVTKEATCTEEGLTTYSCTRCSDVYTEKIEKTAHNMVETVVEPTCTKDGYTVDKCKDCEFESEKRNTVEALGHSCTGKVTKQSTCTENGVMTYSCNHAGCDFSYTESLEKAAHDYEEKVVESTCTKEGYTVDVCKNCGFENNQHDEQEALGHKCKDQVTKEATCTEEGVRTFTCKRLGCDYSYTEAIPMVVHEYEEKVVEPTCVEDGYIVNVCKKCGDTTEKQNIVEAFGHKYKEEVAKVPTCKEMGTKVYTCQNDGCEHSYTENIEKLAHKTVEVVKEATCTVDGYTADVCSDCEEEFNVRDIVKATGHDWTKVSDDVVECKVCGEEKVSEPEETPANPSEPTEKPEDTENEPVEKDDETDSSDKKEEEKNEAPQTGDYAQFTSYIVTLLTALVAGILAINRRKAK